ncbi:DUF2515 family protein [Metabacillus sp. RGM 3146]|uniref:DUF2515 family protein n=1 Tax=Metabacillus sp. RGM 3146 TaxID=3401092 RepID=UPI003B9AD60F
MRYLSLFKSSAESSPIISVLPADEKDLLYRRLADKLSEPKKPSILLKEEQRLIAEIKNQRDLHNINNITRTMAYLTFFERHPEIHWAFLAHMVSRNGGWSMTDLKSHHCGNLLKHEEKESFFLFLEKANAMIFYDAYPQLLLYEYSKRSGKNLFSCLRGFGVSCFMQEIWETYLTLGNSALLTCALITNEQQLLQKRLLQKPAVQAKVFNNPKFALQDYMGMTSVFFPYKKKKSSHLYLLAGVIVSGFQSVQNRILTGKKLYSLLFDNSRIFTACKDFAITHPHNGSRSSYWNHLFSKDKNSALLYSPELTDAWPNVEHSLSEKDDWFHHMNLAEGFEQMVKESTADLSKAVLLNLAKLAPAHFLPSALL